MMENQTDHEMSGTEQFPVPPIDSPVRNGPSSADSGIGSGAERSPQTHSHPTSLQVGSCPPCPQAQNTTPSADLNVAWATSPAMSSVSSHSAPLTPRPTPSDSAHQPSTMLASADEITRDTYQLLADGIGQSFADCFVHAAISPPVTRESLGELSTARILNNPKLRYDVNFDRDLHFRPNLDGSKGKQKQKTAENYWTALHAELWICGAVHTQLAAPSNDAPTRSPDHWLVILKQSHKRLPLVFSTVRNILKTLVPDHDQQVVIERLDVQLLMQEIDKGVCDLVNLADWLAAVLKIHCAPMRDGQIDRMQAQIHEGVAQSAGGKVEMLVGGLRQLLTILEAMRLDVANHQIRHMRPLLVDDSVNFCRRYGAYRITQGRINAVAGREWLDDATIALCDRSSTPLTSLLQVLCCTVFRGLLFNDTFEIFPQMFAMDLDRLRGFRLEIRRLIFIEICCLVLRDVVDPRVQDIRDTQTETVFRKTVVEIVGQSNQFMERLANVAVEIMRTACTLENRPEVHVDSALLGFIEHKLALALKPDSLEYEVAANDLIEHVLPEIVMKAEKHATLPALALQQKFVPPLGSSKSQMIIKSSTAGLVDRMAHTLILHWQIWAPLVYCMPLPPPPPPQPQTELQEQIIHPHGGNSSNQIQITISHAPASPPASPSTTPSQLVYSPQARSQAGPMGVLGQMPTDLPTPSHSPSPSPPPSGQVSSPPPSPTAEKGDERSSTTEAEDAMAWSSSSSTGTTTPETKTKGS